MPKLLKYKKEIFLVIGLVLLLALIRNFEHFFYDPFLNYFKTEYHGVLYPDYNGVCLFFNLLLRYSLNTIISLALIQVLFKDVLLTKFASIMYLLFFSVLIVVFFGILYFTTEANNLFLFYVRRFLIQPLFVLLFVPAFYYQNQINQKS